MKKNLFTILFFLSPLVVAQRNQSWEELQKANKSWVQPKRQDNIQQDEIKQKSSAPQKKKAQKKKKELRRSR